MDQKASPFNNSDSVREIRSASLRFVVLAILFANLVFGDSLSSFTTHVAVSLVYLTVSVASVIAAAYLPKQESLTAAFVTLDAALVVVVLYEHILASPITENHNLTTSSLVVSFILLNHVALKLNRKLIVLFSTIVILSWVLMLAVMSFRHHSNEPGTLLSNFFNQDLGLTMSFAFTAMAVYLLARDHDRTHRQALRIEEKRMNLSRFFSPRVVSDLQNASAILDLERRNAAVMFVDIRDFTSYAETASARELARVLGEYRHIVAGMVFAYGGTVDKFIGDGVMAVFGQPKPQADDAQRAMECALSLTKSLDEWRAENVARGGPPLDTGIGLHYGAVLGGVLESGFHDEFTVIGDAVNVAQRLEALAKLLKSPLVISEAMLQEVPVLLDQDQWIRQGGINLLGRRAPLNIAYLCRPNSLGSVLSPGDYDIGDVHTDFHKSSFQSAPPTPLVGR